MEGEDRVQLDCVRSDPSLAVVEVEERDPGDLCVCTQPDLSTRRAHLPAPERRRPRIAARRRCLGDHVIGARLQHEMQITVLLLANERDRSRH